MIPRLSESMRICAAALTAMMLLPVHGLAQSISASPIEIDVADDGFLIAAFVPQPDLAPRMSPGTQASRVALSSADGAPQPSIILGRIAPRQEEAFGIEGLLPATVEEIGLRYDDVAARAELRASDPELFAKLLSGGHLDPPDAELRRALQTELARMNCYRSGIDGAWGPGSRRSVSAYFEEVDGVDWPDQEPSNGLFRTIIGREDIACPAPVAAARSTTPRRTTAAAPRRAATAAAPTRRAAPAARSQPAPAPKRRIKATSGVGVFR
ncbi:hypothetical protein KDD17_17350 [Sulfitobacter albidus]|uniref:Uncharacterized protein n=1 Tax=Sulfitobacter albidus TaxID=2829501 RepID=A0A975PNQ6_9RHOB|nr:hypothetical protein [Sulfitobacter albidus]QUJ78107.1 hypothetical protein KDD17_17350 [Sulfitobacter albidus]